jgi:hypothetical protein
MEIDAVEEVINEISDRDWSWWPFLWLRPEKHAELSLGRIVILSVLYGIPSSVLLGLGISLQRVPSHTELVLTAFAFPMMFLFSGSILIAPMWNRRAERLRARIK